jgi:hypothetical protein
MYDRTLVLDILRNDSGTSGANRLAAAGHCCALSLKTP